MYNANTIVASRFCWWILVIIRPKPSAIMESVSYVSTFKMYSFKYTRNNFFQLDLPSPLIYLFLFAFWSYLVRSLILLSHYKRHLFIIWKLSILICDLINWFVTFVCCCVHVWVRVIRTSKIVRPFKLSVALLLFLHNTVFAYWNVHVYLALFTLTWVTQPFPHSFGS